MTIKLRTEQPADYAETEHVTREAFWNHYSPGCNEHYLLHIMRGSPSFIPELDVVAVHGGRIVGNIVYAKSVIRTDDGKECEVLGMGPISVLPEYQRRGIGRQMIEHTKMKAREMGFRAILLYGDPDYYSRHGFVAAETLGIRTADDMYAAALQVCELQEEALSGRKAVTWKLPCMILMKSAPPNLTCIFRQRRWSPELRRKSALRKLPPCGEKRIREPETGNPCTLRMS